MTVGHTSNAQIRRILIIIIIIIIIIIRRENPLDYKKFEQFSAKNIENNVKIK